MAERIVNYKDVTLSYAKAEIEKAGYTPDKGGKTASKKTKQTWSYDGKEYSTEAEATQAAQQAIVDKNFAAASPEAKRGMIDEYSGIKGLGDAQQQIIDNINTMQMQRTSAASSTIGLLSYQKPQVYQTDQAQALNAWQRQPTPFETRVSNIQDWEQGAAERQQKSVDFFKVVPGLGGDNFAQRATRYALAAPVTFTVGFGEQVMIGGAKVSATIEGLNRNPSSTKGELISTAKQTPGAVGRSLNPTTPEGLVNDLLIVGMVTRGGGPVGLEKTSIRLPMDGAAEPKLVYSGVGLRTGNTGRALFGQSESGFGFGKPKLNMEGSGAFIAENPTSTSIIRYNIGRTMSAEKLAVIDSMTMVTRATQNVKSADIMSKYPRGTETLSPASDSLVLSKIKSENGLSYGSGAQQVQVSPEIWSKYRGSKGIADRDVFFDKSQLKTEQIVQGLTSDINTLGADRAYIGKTSPLLIQSKGQHAVDIHSRGTATTDILNPAVDKGWAWGNRLNRRAIKVEGIKTMQLAEQGSRKQGSILTIREGGKEFGPEAHRVKDVADWQMTQEQLIQSIKNPTKQARANDAFLKAKQGLQEMFPESKGIKGEFKPEYGKSSPGRRASVPPPLFVSKSIINKDTTEKVLPKQKISEQFVSDDVVFARMMNQLKKSKNQEARAKIIKEGINDALLLRKISRTEKKITSNFDVIDANIKTTPNTNSPNMNIFRKSSQSPSLSPSSFVSTLPLSGVSGRQSRSAGSKRGRPSTGPSVSPSVSIFTSPSVSPSVSLSPSPSRSVSPSPSIFKSPSPSPSRSPSPSPSPYTSPSPSIFRSPSPSPSTSPSPSPNPSPSLSPSPSPSPSVMNSYFTMPAGMPAVGGLPNFGGAGSKGKGGKRKFQYTASIAGAALGIKATDTRAGTTGIGIRGVAGPKIKKPKMRGR